MGKKSAKGKEKKIKRMEENAQRTKAAELTEKAKAKEEGLLEGYELETTGCPWDDKQIDIRTYTARSIGKECLEWAFQLCKGNMEAFYEPVWGWNDEKKREELQDEAARYLVANSTEGNEPLGYVHIRFEVEETRPVLYVYELQISPQAQSRGLGKLLMAAVEIVARKTEMACVMLTVLKGNARAVNFYYKLGYRLDQSSPGVFNPLGEHGYEILSKPKESFGVISAAEIG